MGDEITFAEDECRRRNIDRLVLSTAEIQTAALALYRSAGYKLVRVPSQCVLEFGCGAVSDHMRILD
jgi:hypothetical protein